MNYLKTMGHDIFLIINLMGKIQHPYNISLKTDLDRINLIFKYFILFIYLLNLLVILSHTPEIIHKR